MSKRKWLIEAREAKGYTQVDVANAIGTKRQAVCNWENGRGKPIKRLRIKLCELLEVSGGKFYGSEEVR